MFKFTKRFGSARPTPKKDDRQIDNAITVSCDLPDHLRRDLGDQPAASVYSSIKDRTYNLQPGDTRYFPLKTGEWIHVKRLSLAPCLVINNAPFRVMLETTTKDDDVLDDVLDPRQSRRIIDTKSITQITSS